MRDVTIVFTEHWRQFRLRNDYEIVTAQYAQVCSPSHSALGLGSVPTRVVFVDLAFVDSCCKWQRGFVVPANGYMQG